MSYATDDFFDAIYSLLRKESLCDNKDKDRLIKEILSRRDTLKKLIGLDKLEELDYKSEINRIESDKYEMDILPGLSFPLWILRPESEVKKTVLYLPGHDKYGAQGSFNDYGQKDPFHKWLPLKLYSEGFTVIIPELIGFGEMIKEKYSKGFEACYANTEVAQLLGLNIAGIRTYQALGIIKASRSVLDHPVSYIYGVSGGGLIAALVSAFETELEAVVISNYGAEFKSSIMSIEHCTDNYIPSLIEKVGECADLIALGAPKRLMLTNGIRDNIFPVEGVKKTIDELKQIYDVLGAEDKFCSHLHNGGHEASVDDVIDFFVNV